MATSQANLKKPIKISTFIVKLQEKPLNLKIGQKLYIRHRINNEGDFADTKALTSSVDTKQALSLHENSRSLDPGSLLTIQICKKHRKTKLDVRYPTVISYDDIWNGLRLTTSGDLKSRFKVAVNNTELKMELWLDVTLDNLRAAQLEIATVKQNLHSAKSYLGSASGFIDLALKIGTALSELNPIAKAVVEVVNIVWGGVKAQDDVQKKMVELADGVENLVDCLQDAENIVQLELLEKETGRFFRLMGRVIKFIEDSLKDPFKFLRAQDNVNKVNDFKQEFKDFRNEFYQCVNSVLQEDKKLEEDILQGKRPEPSDRADECMEGTRTDVLKDVEEKINDLEGGNLIWIRGRPGAGKSAIASSIMKSQGQNGLYFRFDRGNNATTPHSLWRGIAYRLARRYSSVRACIRKYLKDDPSKIGTSNVNELFTCLVKDPLMSDDSRKIPGPLVFIIDAVDECGGLAGPQSPQRKALLRTLKQWPRLPKQFKLVMTSRHESDIEDAVAGLGCTNVDIPSGRDVTVDASNDIRKFLEARLPAKLKRHRENVEELTERAAGIFQWAKTAVRIIEDGGPEEQLEKIREKGLVDAPEYEEDPDKPLYSLYSIILEGCFTGRDKNKLLALKSVLRAMAFAKQPLYGTIGEWAEFFTVSEGMLEHIRNRLLSVIDKKPSTNNNHIALCFNHLSFTDYLLSSECPSDFAIKDSEPELAQKCLTIMSKRLRFNICGLETSCKTNAEFSDMDTRIVKCIPLPLLYACRFWVDHLSDKSFPNLEGMVKEMVEDKLLFWLEVMSLLKEVNRVIPMLRRIQGWLDEAKNGYFSEFVHDALRFVAAFGQPISQSAPHIYLSALPFAPVQSLVAQHFRRRFPHTLELVKGRSAQWSSLIFSMSIPGNNSTYPGCVTFSPDQQSFAGAPGGILTPTDPSIRIYDTDTGALLSGPFHYNSRVICLDFSPDGLFLMASYADGTVVGWDTRSSQQYFSLPSPEPGIGSFLHNQVGYCDGGQRLLTVMGCEDLDYLSVTLWDVTNVGGAQQSVWSQTTSRHSLIAFSLHANYLACGVTQGGSPTIEIWNIRDGTVRLSLPTSSCIAALAISEDGCHLMCYFTDHTICIWSRSADGMQYDVLRKVVNHHRLHHRDPRSVGERFDIAYSQASGLLVALTAFGIVAWDAANTGKEVFNYQEFMWVMSLSRDGKRLLFGQGKSPIVKMLDLGYHSTGNNLLHKLDYSGFDYGFDIKPPQPQHIIVEPWDCPEPNRRWVIVDLPQPRHQRHVIVKSSSTQDRYLGEDRFWIEYHKDNGTRTTREFPDARRIMPSPDGTFAIIWNRYDSPPFYAWSTITGQVLPVSFEDAKDAIWHKAAFSPAGRLMATYSHDGTMLLVWDTNEGHLVACIKVELTQYIPNLISPPAISPDEHLIAYRFGRDVMVRDIHTGAPVAGPCRNGFGKIHFTADGKKLISYTESSHRVWDISSDFHSTPNTSTGGFRDDSDIDPDGWVRGHDKGILFWIPSDHRKGLHRPRNIGVKEIGSIETKLDFKEFEYASGENWQKVQDH